MSQHEFDTAFSRAFNISTVKTGGDGGESDKNKGLRTGSKLPFGVPPWMYPQFKPRKREKVMRGDNL